MVNPDCPARMFSCVVIIDYSSRCDMENHLFFLQNKYLKPMFFSPVYNL